MTMQADMDMQVKMPQTKRLKSSTKNVRPMYD